MGSIKMDEKYVEHKIEEKKPSEKLENGQLPPDENEERPQWSSSTEFLMSCIATSVGLGNIWRFPFTAYENGGGAFLIPYIVVLFIIGKPMYYLEMILGQFNSKAIVSMYEFSPAFKGVGIGQIVATICVITYYCSLIALTLYYFVVSFSTELPWSRCLESWGADCVDSAPLKKMMNQIATQKQQEQSENLSNFTRLTSSSEYYFLNEILREKNDISDGIGNPNYKLVLCLFVSWVIIFFVIIKSVKSSGKAAYFLALFPYIVMLALLVRAVTLEGAVDGIVFFLKPQWEELLNIKVWKEAITQLFFSLSVGLGPIVMYASYNNFKHNIYRDAMIVTTLDTFTSLMAGITIFGILGNLAFNLGIDDIQDVVKSGTGLAFISYPDAISKFNVVPQIFSVLFFCMLFVLGIGSVVALQNTVVTVLKDQFQSTAYWKIALICCIIGFCSGLMYLTPGGQWMLTLVDHFGGTLLVFALGLFELGSVFWVYGIEKFCWDLEFMTGRSASLYWRLCWVVITPVFMILVFIYSLIQLEPLKYSGWSYPPGIMAFGWGVFAFGMLIFPVWALIFFIRKKSSMSYGDSFKALFTPSDNWGPIDKKRNAEWVLFINDKREQRIQLSKNHSFIKRNLFILFGRY